MRFFKNKTELQRTPHRDLVARVEYADRELNLKRAEIERLKSYWLKMEESRDFYQKKAEHLSRRLSATKGVVTKLKKAADKREV